MDRSRIRPSAGKIGPSFSAHAAPLHNCKYRRLQAPATNISNSRQRLAVSLAGRCCQHPAKIPSHFQERITGRNDDRCDGTAEGVARRLALLLRPRVRSRGSSRAEDLRAA